MGVLNHFSLVRYIGIGIGLGANVLVRHALQYPERVDSLMVANACSGKAGWVEWGYQKRNVSHLRTEIPLTRDISEKNTLTPPVLNLVGIHSPFIEESVSFNGQLTPSKTNWIKVQEAAMVLEEQPGKVCQALRLFLQGQGFCLKLRNSNL